ncbi:MAG: hypothetical protein SOI44_02470 [Lactimicrobium sp.]|jgi:hypothetical protein|uniref:hypothetical protein n=1 Tax=Lactimicrobium sp. TaxID=2563780 RepID=UPI002F35B07B
MTPAELKQQIVSVRKKLNAEMRTGIQDPSLKKQLDLLCEQENQLLEQALPYYRRKALMTRDLKPEKEVVVKDLSHLKECDLDPSVYALCKKLRDSELEEIKDPPAAVPECHGNVIMTLQNDQVCFVFTDEGSVYLQEKNLGTWQCRPAPLFCDVLCDNGVLESDSSCLVRNLDGGVDRLCYARVDTVEQLMSVNLYE